MPNRTTTSATSKSHRHGAAERSYDPSPGERRQYFWGYTDTRFAFCGPRLVQITGNRYPLSGTPLPNFIPYVEDILGVSLDPDLLREDAPPPAMPPPKTNDAFLQDLVHILPDSKTDTTDTERLAHSHGQLSVDEIYRILTGGAPKRIVDLVIYPESDSEVAGVLKLATRHNVVLIPYGGGTNVSGALQCPENEDRMVVSVDLRRLNRIIEIDRENNWAIVEAGITGKDLESQLEDEGLTCGHIPDSIELSTLGGWIATNASGMKRYRYGNIEDLVLEAVLATPQGEIKTLPVTPRSSIGVEPGKFLFGSEGNFGIITRAVMQVFPLPEVRKFGSFLFPSFADGVGFLKDVESTGVRPSSLRLVNNTEFRLGRAISPAKGKWKARIEALKKFYLLRVKGFDPQRMVACTLVMEGSRREVKQQEKELARAGRRAGGISGGAEGGRRGYQATFAIAYIRDFLNRFDVIGETFETSTPWSRITPITTAVEKELFHLCGKAGVKGSPYLAYRVSQTYHSGVCIYFTMGFCARGLEDPVDTYQKIEHRLREVILENGGSVSHHHGIGKIRSSFMPGILSAGGARAIRAAKNALDPRNIFAAGNNLFAIGYPDGQPESDSSSSRTHNDTP